MGHTVANISMPTRSIADFAHTFPFGIEEEYFLVDAKTKAIALMVPEALFGIAKASSEGRIKGEFLRQQIEVTTKPHVEMTEARAELRQLRHKLAGMLAPHGLEILAAGTHPTAAWTDAQQTRAERYDNVMHDLQMIGRRNMLCGMHVHVELPNPKARVDVMTRMLPYLPIFIALATSSPFWQSQHTGLLGYRLAAYDELPRTGVPELFRRVEGYELYVDTLVQAGVMPDASYIWWAMRPSVSNPTLELRAPRLLHPPGRYRSNRCTLSDACAPGFSQSTAKCQSYRPIAGHRGREQVARPALRGSRELPQRTGSARRAVRPMARSGH